MLKNVKITYDGTRTNNLIIKIDGRRAGTMDYDHRTITLYSEYKNINKETIVTRLAEYDVNHQCDYEEAYNDYNGFNIFYEKDEKEEEE